MKCILLAIMLCAQFYSFAQQPDHSKRTESGKSSAVNNVTGFTKLLGLNKEQQTQWQQIDGAFYDKIQAARLASSKSNKTSASKEVYDWYEREISQLLTSEQLRIYKERKAKILSSQKMRSSDFAKPADKAVSLKK